MVEAGRPTRTFAAAARRLTFASCLVLVTASGLSTPAHAQDGRDITIQLPGPAAVPRDDADGDFHLGAATGQAFGFTVFQHVVRLREAKTRNELGGAFVQDWFKSVKNTGRTWDDGGKFFTNYIAHPLGGGVYANIDRQNDPRRRRLEAGEPGYGGLVTRAMIFSAAVSTQFELGPVSEASIGNVGMRNPAKMAWVDLVITPVLGTAWMVGEDVI